MLSLFNKPPKHVAQAYMRLFDTPDGKIVLQDLLRFTRPYDDMDCTSHAAMCLHEGLRRPMTRIQTLANLSPVDMEKMYKEIKRDE